MSLKHPAKAALLICMCAMLCACGTAPAISDSVASNMPQSESTTVQTTTTAAASTAAQTTTTVTTASAEPDEPKNDRLEPSFVSVLTEDDIKYMGIPYKDLTIEQFIQLWAQCTRECNVQRLYVITYDNNYCKDELTGERREPTALEEQETLTEMAELSLEQQRHGRVLFLYNDVELFKAEDAPEGYYDSAESEPHTYFIKFRRVWYEGEQKGEANESGWITLKKINGYWKIGSSHSSSSPFLNP